MPIEHSSVDHLRAEAARHRRAAKVIRDLVVAAAIIADADDLDRRADSLEREPERA
jgi:hypothetical protein